MSTCSGGDRARLRYDVLVARDGTKLAYHVLGVGIPVVCLPGGPMQDSVYLGDLGGLSGRCQVILFDSRGTGQSESPTDAASYRCDRLVDDVEALREHLGLDRIDLLAHCAGASLAVLYAARRPERIGKLVLVAPSTRAVGITATGEMRREIVRLREGEPWFGRASTAFDAIQAGQATDADWEAMTPLTYGRWDAAARAHHASGDTQRNEEAAAAFSADGAFDPTVTRGALAIFGAQVLLLAGALDVAAPPGVVTEFAGLFPSPTLVIQPGGGHSPWLDDPSWFTTAVATFLK